MQTSSKWALRAALIVFLAFFANVTFGAAGGTPIFSDVGEMLVLFGAVLLFVIGLLLREQADLERSS